MIENLNNSEISCVYYQFKKHFDELTNTLNNGYRTEQHDIEAEGMQAKSIFLIEISDQEVAAVKSSHYYQTIKSIVDKLSPIVELIEEAEPQIKTNLEQ
jgi:hypothetical protein